MVYVFFYRGTNKIYFIVSVELLPVIVFEIKICCKIFKYKEERKNNEEKLIKSKEKDCSFRTFLF